MRFSLFWLDQSVINNIGLNRLYDCYNSISPPFSPPFICGGVGGISKSSSFETKKSPTGGPGGLKKELFNMSISGWIVYAGG